MAGEMKLERSLERWADCNPYAIGSSSQAAVMFFASDAQKDIATLAAAVATLLSEKAELLGNLKRVTDHLETWARDHSLESTCETWAVLHCAKETISKAGGQSNG